MTIFQHTSHGRDALLANAFLVTVKKVEDSVRTAKRRCFNNMFTVTLPIRIYSIPWSLLYFEAKNDSYYAWIWEADDDDVTVVFVDDGDGGGGGVCVGVFVCMYVCVLTCNQHCFVSQP